MILTRGYLCAEALGAPAFLQNGPYANLGREYLEIQARLQALGVPSQILEERLREAMAKRVDIDTLRAALASDEERLGRIARALSATGHWETGAKERLEQFKSLSMVTTGIISLETLEAYMAALPAQAGSPSALSAWVQATISLYNLSDLSDGQLRSLGESVLSSKLKPSGYAIIPGLFLKARRNGLTDAETLKSMLRVLSSGGGVFQLEDEVSRRKGP
jgi:hypothetical protein